MKIQIGDRIIVLNVNLKVLIPNGKASEKEVTEWIQFHFGEEKTINPKNSLVNLDPHIVKGDVDWKPVKAGLLKIKENGEVGAE